MGIIILYQSWHFGKCFIIPLIFIQMGSSWTQLIMRMRVACPGEQTFSLDLKVQKRFLNTEESHKEKKNRTLKLSATMHT